MGMGIDYYVQSTATDRGDYQSTADIVSNTDRRDVSEMLDLLALADTPFINAVGWGADSGGQSIEWITEDLGPGYIVVGSVHASNATSLEVGTTENLTTAEAMKQLQTGSVLYHYSSTDGEHALYAVSAYDSAGEVEVELLSCSSASIVSTSSIAGDKLYVLGGLANEGSLPRTGRWRARAIASNGFTILRQDVQITGSQKSTDFYAIGKEDQHQVLMRLKEMQRERERVALYGAAAARATSNASMMNGVFGFLLGETGDHIDSSTTTLTESAVNDVIGACWEAGSTNLTFFGARTQTAKFTQWDKNRIRMAPRDARGGGYVTKYMSEIGVEVDIVPMRNVPKNLAFLLDTTRIKLRAKNGRKGLMEKLGKAGDFDDWQIISEFSMEMKGYNLRQHGMFSRLS